MTTDGAWVAFESLATKLVAGVTDANLAMDVFLYSTVAGTNRLVSRHHTLRQTESKPSGVPVLDPLGRRLAFISPNGNLAPSTPTGGTKSLLYLHDIASGTNLWASRAAADLNVPVSDPSSRLVPWKATFSGDGRFLIYGYGPLVLRYDTANDATTIVATNLAEAGLPLFGPAPVAANGDGSVIAYQGSRSNVVIAKQPPDAVYLWTQSSQTVTRLEVPIADTDAIGQVGGPAVSADGRFVAYLVQIVADTTGLAGPGLYLIRHDLQSGAAAVVTVPDAMPTEGIPGLSEPLWSADLRRLCFASDASDLVADDRNRARDAFLLDLEPFELRLLSARDATLPGGRASGSSTARGQCFSADGRLLVFTSTAEDLVSNDRNDAGDVFLQDLNTGATTLVSVAAAGTASGNGYSHSPVISADGRFVAFTSLASDLVEGDTNGLSDVFVRDLTSGTTLLASHVWNGTGSGFGQLPQHLQ